MKRVSLPLHRKPIRILSRDREMCAINEERKSEETCQCTDADPASTSICSSCVASSSSSSSVRNKTKRLQDTSVVPIGDMRFKRLEPRYFSQAKEMQQQGRTTGIEQQA